MNRKIRNFCKWRACFYTEKCRFSHLVTASALFFLRNMIQGVLLYFFVDIALKVAESQIFCRAQHVKANSIKGTVALLWPGALG